MLAADYTIGAPTHRIASMPPASPRDYAPTNLVKIPEPLPYTVPSFIGHLLDNTAPLVPREQPYCMVATINGDPKTRMGFCWFTNEGVTNGEVKIIAKAKQELRSTDTSITIISEQLGFSSVSHFSRLFKSYTGKTPSEYRQTA